MEMKRSAFVLINLAIICLLLVGVLAVGWVFLNTNLDTSQAENVVKFSRMEAAAKVYYGRLNYYSGVCDDIGVPASFSCTDSETAYAVESKLDSGWFYCIDSSGFNGEMPYSKGSGTACKR
jgi:hypothetical protein